MAAPTPSDLDFSQCIQGAYEDATGRLRVDAQITAPLDVNGEVLVDIRASDGDSVLVVGTEDATTTGTQHVLKINPDGSVNANVTIVPSSPLIVKSTFNAITSVSSGILTTILSYTVPVGKTDYLDHIEVSGDNIANFEVYINNVLNARQRTAFTNFNALFEYQVDSEVGYKLIAGTLLQVKVLHNRPSLGNFEARIVYAE